MMSEVTLDTPNVLVVTGEVNCGAYAAAVISELTSPGGLREGGWDIIVAGGGAALPACLCASTKTNIKKVWIDEHYDYMPKRTVVFSPPWVNTSHFFDTIVKDIKPDVLATSKTQLFMYFTNTANGARRTLVTNDTCKDLKNAVVANYCLPGYTFSDFTDSVVLPFEELKQATRAKKCAIDIVFLGYKNLDDPYIQAIHNTRQADLWAHVDQMLNPNMITAKTSYHPMDMSSKARTELLLLGKDAAVQFTNRMRRK